MIKSKFKKEFVDSLHKPRLCDDCHGSKDKRRQLPGCSLSKPALCKTENLTSALVFCMDCVFEQLGTANTDTHCDEVVFSDGKSSDGEKETWIYCIENKKGKVFPPDVQKQLQGGAKVVKARLPAKDKFNFLPVLVTEKGIKLSHRKQPREDPKPEVMFGGKPYRMHIIQTKRDANLPLIPSPPS